VTFDYPHGRILLEPNGRFAEPFLADESGLSLIATGEGFRRFEVDGVEPGSPAAEAGLRRRDVLTAIDGRPAGAFDLDRVHEALRKVGRTIRLTIARGRNSVDVNLKLRRRI
jgi:S1-C subfamily serine protease